MRHRKNKITLDRKAGPRKALIKNLAESLVLHEHLTTTKAKAKVARSTVEKLITIAKKGTLAARRDLLSKLADKAATEKLMAVYGPRYKDRNGGYTRLTTLPPRKGDGADRAMVEFI
jgi:large subunit ribosomal protein L17